MSYPSAQTLDTDVSCDCSDGHRRNGPNMSKISHVKVQNID